MTTKTYAIEDGPAGRDAFGDNYERIAAGDEHSMTLAEIAEACHEFGSTEEAIDYLHRHGGGWYFDDDGCSYYVAP